MNDRRLVLVNENDNVLVCCGQVGAGETVVLEGESLIMGVDIHVGHKVARRAIGKGEKIFRYGAPIGSATVDIAFGEHVHMHNIKSDYIPSHTREKKMEVGQ
ncbi:UxaA family hydrolase [Gilvimarinus agarilyticus]|uniref:UxaA family hydrolase n=1 Tax=unclassified Gilvimarinus TaxID=2642066 RepID=UPI001C08BC1D|nr:MULTISPECIES: UxaA family hydrolase [unclassified Gilvimarinus]MBU2886176.1 UxaA family hydrolase [Gilvimarinus agarilyticus]MDO6570880.1 UxaA family hydrolase [Gilvimarinus sp. 2_MG-2023]MDO6748591.1 UxaA family hydrolase [Gilvimarinus sp. 1_MG-2023]